MTISRWSRGSVLGRGSSATVFMAVDNTSGEVVAVKSCELGRSASLQNEGKILSRISCPYIIGYRGHEITQGNHQTLYNLFMDFVPGGTLSELVARNGGRLEESAIRYLTRSILHGMEYLHSNQIVHCDIKGSNILIGSKGAIISDFGCAKWVGDQCSSSRIAGTPVFMAPEVACGEKQGLEADIWALGCTVIEMATGCLPWCDFSEADPTSILYRVAFTEDLPEIPSWLSDEGKDFLKNCLFRERTKRWTVKQLLYHSFVEEIGYPSLILNPTSLLSNKYFGL